MKQRTRATREAPRREPAFNLPPVVLALIGICAVVYVVSAYLLYPSRSTLLLLQHAAFIPIRYSGQFDRPRRLHLAADLLASCTARSRIWRST